VNLPAGLIERLFISLFTSASFIVPRREADPSHGGLEKWPICRVFSDVCVNERCLGSNINYSAAWSSCGFTTAGLEMVRKSGRDAAGL
jgi:hypothetical protein